MRQYTWHYLNVWGCFNPRICKRCDTFPVPFKKPVFVSIHASVKDATYWSCKWYLSIIVSIHASVKDATTSKPDIFIALSVSIHASVKDATNKYPHPSHLIGFNPRICKRCDLCLWCSQSRPKCFNPRICKRCDQHSFKNSLPIVSFNPRICKRCDTIA